MTDRSKFEQMLEYLISEEQDKAKELFHQLVVEKSRQIYENILSEDFNEAKEEDEEMDEAREEDDEEMDEAAGDEENMDEAVHVHVHGKGEQDEMEDEGMEMPGDTSMAVADESDDEFGGDATDDMIGDLEGGDDEMGGDEFGGDDMGGEEGEGDLEDRVMDLEDALDDLKAEFEKLMSDEEGEEGGEEGGDEFGADDEAGADDEGSDDEGEEDELQDSFQVSDHFMREYIEKVTNPKHGDNGVNNKSVIDNMKNDMGGTTANLVKSHEEKGAGTKGGLLNPSTKEENFGNINVPGGNAGKTAFKKKEPGHGAEKKSSGDNGDKSTKSPINGLTRRAK